MSMTLKIDVGVASLAKDQEEVCGDTVEIVKNDRSTTIVLSDGLGSGIKASILSILSTKIASGLLRRNVSLEQVFATIADTLPTCKVRNLAYSTLSILRIKTNGDCHLIEYDNPMLLRFKAGKRAPLKRQKREIAGKEVLESWFRIEPEDLLVMVSDGVINAGVGGLYRLGLGYKGLVNSVLDWADEYDDALPLAQRLIEVVDACYLGRRGDDSTSIVVRARIPRTAVLLTGPPADPKLDRELVDNYLSYRNVMRIVCGGATGNLVAREMGQELKTSLKYEDPSVPPTAQIKGIDLVTEGILTLNKCLSKLKSSDKDWRSITRADGASLLCHALSRADRVIMLVGTAVNPAHEEFMNSLQLLTRTQVVEELKEELTKRDKEVIIEKF
jgi:hypothetical protein